MPSNCFWHLLAMAKLSLLSFPPMYIPARSSESPTMVSIWASEINVCSLYPGPQTWILVPVGFCVESPCGGFLFLGCPQGIHSFSCISLANYHSYLTKLGRQLITPLNEKLFLFVCFCFYFLGCTFSIWKFPGLGVKSELQLLAYVTATATPDPSLAGNLHHSSRQCQILNPLSQARDSTWILINTSQNHFHCVTMGSPKVLCIFSWDCQPSGTLLGDRRIGVTFWILFLWNTGCKNKVGRW